MVFISSSIMPKGWRLGKTSTFKRLISLKVKHLKKNYLNVWNWSYTKRYYLTHPWRWFRELGWNIRSTYQRATKGYTYTDWANFDTWFIHVATGMLRDMALHSHGYPGTEPFETPEKWSSWLHRMADQFEYLQDEDNGNEWYRPYIDHIMDCPKDSILGEETPGTAELRKKYSKRAEEVYKDHKQLFQSTMKELLEHWDCLWD